MNGWDMFYDGATSLGGRIAENKREGELTAALRKLFGMDKNSGNTAGNNTATDGNGKIDYDNAIINGFNQFAANSDSSFTRMMRANSDGSLYNVDPNSGTKLQATQASPYNASADYGVDLNNPYSMADRKSVV